MIGLPYEQYYRKAFVIQPSFFRDWESFTATQAWWFMYKLTVDSQARDNFISSYVNPVEYTKVSICNIGRAYILACLIIEDPVLVPGSG